MASSSVQSQKPAQQSDHVQPAAVTTHKTNKSHQSCREKVKEMANKMFHHDQAAQHGNLQASNGQGHQSADQASQTACAERKKKEAHCMPRIRVRMKIIKKKKNKEGTTGDTSGSSSSDEGDHAGKGTRKKN